MHTKANETIADANLEQLALVNQEAQTKQDLEVYKQIPIEPMLEAFEKYQINATSHQQLIVLRLRYPLIQIKHLGAMVNPPIAMQTAQKYMRLDNVRKCHLELELLLLGANENITRHKLGERMKEIAFDDNADKKDWIQIWKEMRPKEATLNVKVENKEELIKELDQFIGLGDSDLKDKTPIEEASFEDVSDTDTTAPLND